jgi:hypothetical protein
MTMLDLPWPALLLQGVEAITTWESRQLGKRETTKQPARSKLVGWAVQCYLRGTHVLYSTVLVRSQLYWHAAVGPLWVISFSTSRRKPARQDSAGHGGSDALCSTNRTLGGQRPWLRCPDAAEGPRPKRRTRPRHAPTEGTKGRGRASAAKTSADDQIRIGGSAGPRVDGRWTIAEMAMRPNWQAWESSWLKEPLGMGLCRYDRPALWAGWRSSWGTVWGPGTA